MAQGSAQLSDINLTRHDIQALNSPGAIAAFFARLGYDTDTRTVQTRKNSVLCPRNWSPELAWDVR